MSQLKAIDESLTTDVPPQPTDDLPQSPDDQPLQPKRHKMAMPHEQRSVNATYYIVCINFPRILSSSVNMEDLKQEAELYNFNLDGKFITRYTEYDADGAVYRIHLFDFTKSKAASSAKVEEFIFIRSKVDTNKILNESDVETRFCINLELTTVSAATQAVTAAERAGEQRVCQMMFDKSSSNEGVRAFVEEVCSALNVSIPVPVPTRAVSIVPLRNVPEVMYNELFFSQVKEEATKMGYTVVNKCNISDSDLAIVSKPSRYSLSKPDLVIYHSEELVAYVIHAPVDEELNEELNEEPDVTLSAGMTENKLDIESQKLGQLLAGMEKVAGDIAFLYLSQADIPFIKRKFKFIQVYGLQVNHISQSCKVYKLVMDFKNCNSVLYVGKQELTPAEAISRLLVTMKKRAT